jgi:hypothetical protein
LSRFTKVAGFRALWLERLTVVDRFEVDFERATHRDSFARPDRVEELPVGLDLLAQLVTVVDFEPVEVLVLQ